MEEFQAGNRQGPAFLLSESTANPGLNNGPVPPAFGVATRHIAWRGNLKTCNYSCHYCPFAKRKGVPALPASEAAAMQALITGISNAGKAGTPCEAPEGTGSFRGSVLLAPYGEGLFHAPYQNLMATLSRLEAVRKVSCQTNLSLDADAFLARLKREGASLDKIALWATYHPSMERADIFIAKCLRLSESVSLSVGMVGDPDSLDVAQRLKSALPDGVRFWLNKMDGLGRPYTQSESERLAGLDPHFWMEETRFACDGECEGAFVDAHGQIHGCVRNKGADRLSGKVRMICDCFLAYSNRKDIADLIYGGPYPQLRLAGVRPKALFFDLDGCLAKGGRLMEGVRETLERLSERYAVYLATGRSKDNVARRFGRLPFLAGGVYDYGAHVEDIEKSWQRFTSLSGKTYEMTGDISGPIAGTGPLKVRLASTGPVLRSVGDMSGFVVNGKASKAGGVAAIAALNAWSEEEILAFGDSDEDAGMLSECPYSVATPNASALALKSARHCMDFRDLAMRLERFP